MTRAPFLPIPPAVTHGPVKLLSSRLRTWRCENCTRLSGRVPDRRFPWVCIEDRAGASGDSRICMQPIVVASHGRTQIIQRACDWISYNLSQPFSPKPNGWDRHVTCFALASPTHLKVEGHEAAC